MLKVATSPRQVLIGQVSISDLFLLPGLRSRSYVDPDLRVFPLCRFVWIRIRGPSECENPRRSGTLPYLKERAGPSEGHGMRWTLLRYLQLYRYTVCRHVRYMNFLIVTIVRQNDYRLLYNFVI